MKKMILFTVLSFRSLILLAQATDFIVNQDTYAAPFKQVVVEGGVTIPIGKLSNMMNVSPNVGFWYRIPKENNIIQNIGFSINFPKSQNFNYVNDNYTTEIKSFSGLLGVKMDKLFWINEQKHRNLEWSSVIGYGFYFFDDVRARAEYATWSASKKDQEDKPAFIKPFSTVHLAQGFKINLKNFGIYTRYNYAPYSIFTDIIDNNFGAHSVSVGFYYRQ